MEDKYLKLLARDYPNRRSARCEIVNLSAMSELPKGTEYFFSDLHGEHKGFSELLKGASGVLREKIRVLFTGRLSEPEQNQLANLLYDPEKVLELMHRYHRDTRGWMRQTIWQLTLLCREVGAKYSRFRVRSKIPAGFEYIFEELLYPGQEEGKGEYCRQIIDAVVDHDMGDAFIPALCHLIRNVNMDIIHVIGDIYDRGPRPDLIMEDLIALSDVDVQWGNHDISWMGAACGNEVLVANVVRLGISYNNYDCLEDGYGINLRPLSAFAGRVYREDPCLRFLPKILDENLYDRVDRNLSARMHKAIAIIQLKLIGQLVHRRPEYGMERRSFLEHIDYSRMVYIENGKEYPLLDTVFPTVDPAHPLELTEEERQLMGVLCASFRHSEALQRHVRFLYSHGSMYLKANGNLLFHGCIPMEEDKSLQRVRIRGREYCGKALLDELDRVAQDAYFLPEGHPDRQECVDLMWFMWCAAQSPLFGKSKMSAFERYFTADRQLHEEVYNPYYTHSRKKEICCGILREFGLDEKRGHIINGHVPVQQKKGEKPVKAEGKLYVIDGGLSKAYQTKTGIAGYTLIFNSHYLALAQHQDYMTQSESLSADIPTLQVTERMEQRILVKDTDAGARIQERIAELKELAEAYEEGRIREHSCSFASERPGYPYAGV